MKKATLIVWVIILGFIALVIFQNQSFFMTNQSLRLNLGVINEYQTPELPIAVVFIFFFFSGIVIAYLFSFSTRFKARRTTKKLNATIASHKDEVTKLTRELDTLKGQETPTVEQSTETKTGTEDIIELTDDRLVKNPGDQQAVNPAKGSNDEKS